MAFSYDPELFDSVSRIRFAVGDLSSPGLLEDASYEAMLRLSSDDEAAATRGIAAHLAVRYAQEPDRIGSDGSSISWSERVAQWNRIASGTAGGANTSVGKGMTLRRGPARDWTSGEGDAA